MRGFDGREDLGDGLGRKGFWVVGRTMVGGTGFECEVLCGVKGDV